jgi:hypothetical protein
MRTPEGARRPRDGIPLSGAAASILEMRACSTDERMREKIARNDG